MRFLKGFDLTLTLSLASHFKSSQRRGETHDTLLHTIDAQKDVQMLGGCFTIINMFERIRRKKKPCQTALRSLF